MPASSQRYTGAVRRYYEAEYNVAYMGRKHRDVIMPNGATQDAAAIVSAHLRAQPDPEQPPIAQRYWKQVFETGALFDKLVKDGVLTEDAANLIHDRAYIDAFIQLGREGDIKYRERWIALSHVEGQPPQIDVIHYKGKGEGPAPDDRAMYVEFNFDTAIRSMLSLLDADVPLGQQPTGCLLHVYRHEERWPDFNQLVGLIINMNAQKAFV